MDVVGSRKMLAMEALDECDEGPGRKSHWLVCL